MAVKVLFITVNLLKKKSIIDGNVDSGKLLQYIEVAQDTHIQNYLGGTLYNKLMDLIVSSDIELPENADYKFLLDEYVRDMLIWFTQEAYLPFSMFQVNNGGVYKHVSENSDLANKDEVEYLIQKTRNYAEFYTKRFLDYMCNNSVLYKEYSNNKQGEMYPDKDVNFTGGWYV
jgi:hypothetical protein